MPDQAELFGVLMALKFVAVAAIVLLLVPLEVAAPIIPLFLVLLFALHRYRSRAVR